MRPFEWLTSPSSLEPLLLKALDGGKKCGDDEDNHKHGGELENSNNSAVQHEHEQSQETKTKMNVLHVGSGSSALGEFLLQDPKFQKLIQHVVNVDCDGNILQAMEERWKQQQRENKVMLHDDEETEESSKMSFVRADFATDDKLEYPDGWFDLIVDKSTLDCTLCSDRATAGLLLEVYRLLKDSGGVYLVVSFHHVDFLKPLLEVPGFDWEIECYILERQVEDLITKNGNEASSQKNERRITDSAKVPSTPIQAAVEQAPPPWSNNAHGTFEPDENYRRNVNVLLCRKRRGSSSNHHHHPQGTPPPTGSNHSQVFLRARLLLPDRETVSTHVHAVNDEWYQSQNPMLTQVREQEIALAFEKLLQQQHEQQQQREDVSQPPQRPSAVAAVEVIQGYRILFTPEEQEHYSFDLFLEDWQEYCDNKNHVLHHGSDVMSYESAINFLKEMQ